MKHRKKMLQYAQDAQVTDTPWKWWKYKYHDTEWTQCAQESMAFFEDAKYRRKPQWEIDGKFKVGDRVTFADLPAVRVCHASLIGQVFTVRGFATSKEADYRVLLKDEICNVGVKGVRQSLLTLVPQRLEVLSKAVGFDVPMPLQEAPGGGTEVFVAFTPQTSSLLWNGARSDVDELKANRLHLTAENAEIHAKALAAISSPLFCQRLPK